MTNIDFRENNKKFIKWAKDFSPLNAGFDAQAEKTPSIKAFFETQENYNLHLAAARMYMALRADYDAMTADKLYVLIAPEYYMELERVVCLCPNRAVPKDPLDCDHVDADCLFNVIKIHELGINFWRDPASTAKWVYKWWQPNKQPPVVEGVSSPQIFKYTGFKLLSMDMPGLEALNKPKFECDYPTNQEMLRRQIITEIQNKSPLLQDIAGYEEYRNTLLNAKPAERRYLWLSDPASVVELAKLPPQDLPKYLADYMANFPYGLPDSEFIKLSKMFPQAISSVTRLADEKIENPYASEMQCHDMVLLTTYGLAYYMLERAIPDKKRLEYYVNTALRLGAVEDSVVRAEFKLLTCVKSMRSRRIICSHIGNGKIWDVLSNYLAHAHIHGVLDEYAESFAQQIKTKYITREMIKCHFYSFYYDKYGAHDATTRNILIKGCTGYTMTDAQFCYSRDIPLHRAILSLILGEQFTPDLGRRVRRLATVIVKFMNNLATEHAKQYFARQGVQAIIYCLRRYAKYSNDNISVEAVELMREHPEGLYELVRAANKSDM